MDSQNVDTSSMTEHEIEEHENEKLKESLQFFGTRLHKLAMEQVQLKSNIEERWLDDLRAYHGQYDDETLKRIRDNKGSEIYVNITRHKCNTAEARLVDMLFPSDDRNWSISSTPVPEIIELSQSDKVVSLPSGEEVSAKEVASAKLQKANRAAKAMEREIEDQLIEASYAPKTRDTIHDAVILGTGIIKGPVVEGRVKQKWVTDNDGVSALVIEESLEPGIEVVSPWDYFPDMSARNKDECEFEFERKLMTKTEVRRLLKLGDDSGFLMDQIREVLKDEDPELVQNDRFSEVRQISGDTQNTTRNRYELWEYHGPIEEEELIAAGVDADDLVDTGVSGTVLILNQRVIRVSLNPLDTEESPYSVFSWESDATSIFGFGVPYLIRSPQKMVNASTRMIMDNGKLAVGPQIAINKKLVKPANGDWTIAPFKQWHMNEDGTDIREAIQFINVPSRLSDLSQIYEMGRYLIDEQSSLPAVATGEGDPNAAPQTATGVAIQSGAAKVVFKRVVKNFDDDLTTPTIKRFYDWNMQYNNNPEIKGDMQVQAKGSTSLMVREQEAAMMTDVMKMVDPEEIRRRIKPDEAIREFFRSRNINSSQILRTEEELEQSKENEPQQPPNPEMIKLQANIQIEQAKLQQKEQQMMIDLKKWQSEVQQKEQQMVMDYEFKMNKLAADQNTTVEKLNQDSGVMQLKASLEQMKEQNKREIEEMKNMTDRQIAAIKAQQQSNEQQLKLLNIRGGHDTFS